MRENMSKKEQAAWHWGLTYGIMEVLASSGALKTMNEEEVQHAVYKFGRLAVERLLNLPEVDARDEREHHIRVVEAFRDSPIILS